MRFPRKRGSTSNMVIIFVPDNTSTIGAGLTTLLNTSVNLVIGYRREFESAWTEYKQSAGNIEQQTTIGTFQAPSTSAKCRIKHDARGSYEIQFHNDATIFGNADASKGVYIEIYEETTTALKIGPNKVLIPLSALNILDGESDLQTIKTQAITCAAGVTVLANVGFSGAPGASGGALTTNGTKANQTVDLTAGQTIAANLTQILGTVLTETSGYLAAAFKKFFNIATPQSTMDALTSVATAVNLTNLPAVPTDWLTAAGIKADAITKIQTGLATPTNITAASGVTLAASQPGVTIPTVTALTNLPAVPTDWLTAAGVKADAVTKIQNGLATPTNITAGTITTAVNLTNAPTNGDLTATMKSSVTAAVPSASTIAAAVAAPSASTIAAAVAAPTTAQIAAAIGARIPVESYAALTAVPTYDQFLCMILQLLSEQGISGTTKTTRKLDGTTSAMTHTLNNADKPTNITRAT